MERRKTGEEGMIDDIADLISRLLTVFMIGSLILFTGAYTVDSFTVEQTGNESVPCLDEMYRPFENHLRTILFPAQTWTCVFS